MLHDFVFDKNTSLWPFARSTNENSIIGVEEEGCWCRRRNLIYNNDMKNNFYFKVEQENYVANNKLYKQI